MGQIDTIGQSEQNWTTFGQHLTTRQHWSKLDYMNKLGQMDKTVTIGQMDKIRQN